MLEGALLGGALLLPLFLLVWLVWHYWLSK
jgi:hypothetical protein